MLAKTKALLALPAKDRNAKIGLGIQRRIRSGISAVIYSTAGYWLNSHNGRYMLEFRPDSHFDLKRVPGYHQLFRDWVRGNRARNCGDLARFYTLFLNIEKVLSDRVPGDFVEVGTYKGNSASILASFARTNSRRLYLFDTFEGFDKKDLSGIDAKIPVLYSDTSLTAVRNFVGAESVTYVKGFFPASAEGIALPDKIAVAHIDCDLYEPMKASLECFYPRMSPGGLMLLHDYSSGKWPGATAAIDEFFRNRKEQPILIPDKSGTAAIRKSH